MLARIRSLLPAERWLLLLDGRSGSGKSTLAAWLAPRLGARVLAVEDLYPGWGGLDAAADLLARRLLPALAAGRPAAYRRWDWAADSPGEQAVVRATPRLVVEGCGALTAASRRFADVAVLLEVPDRVREYRIRRRDPADVLPAHRRWALQERRMRAREPQPVLADLVLRGGVRLPAGADAGFASVEP